MGFIGSFLLGKATFTTLCKGIDNLGCIESLSYGANLEDLCALSSSEENFYLIKDKELKIQGLNKDEEGMQLIYEFGNHFIPRYILPRFYTACSAYQLFQKVPDENVLCLKVCKTFFGVTSALAHLFFIPYVSFKYTSLEIKALKDTHTLKNDDKFCGLAYKINDKVSYARIGFLGILTKILNKNFPSRVQKNPRQFLKGLIQIISAISLLIFIQKSTVKHKNAFRVGLLLS